MQPLITITPSGEELITYLISRRYVGHFIDNRLSEIERELLPAAVVKQLKDVGEVFQLQDGETVLIEVNGNLHQSVKLPTLWLGAVNTGVCVCTHAYGKERGTLQSCLLFTTKP